ncbi:MAG: DMT family transporter [Clostridium sp.]|nr:DMT family transporter [Clostridium sp.]
MTEMRVNLLLVSISIAWGTSYLFMKMGIDGLSTFNFIALRFAVAFLVTFILFFNKIRYIKTKVLIHSAIVGSVLVCIFVPILLGLKTTEASSAAFLISTTVVIVPIMQIFVRRKLPETKMIVSIFIVLIGTGFLTLKNGFTVDFGSVLCLMGAFFNALYIVITGHFAKTDDSLELGIFQLGFAALFASIFSFAFEVPKLPSTTNGWIAVLGLGIICSAYGFVMQPIVQKYTTPENAGLTFAMEPIFAAIFAALFLHEVLNINEYIGAALIMTSLYISSSKGTVNIVNKVKIKLMNSIFLAQKK